DGLTDSVVVSQDGRVLVRLREANAQGTFAPPILVNPGRPARAVTAVHVGGEVLLAATDQSLNPALGRTGNVITLYRISANGRPSVAGELTIQESGLGEGDFSDDSESLTSDSEGAPARNGSQLSRIVAADLNGDGVEDLAVLDRLNGLPGVAVFLG